MLNTKRRRKPSQKAYLDALLDQALEETFPASDPVAITIEHGPIEVEPSPELELSPARIHPRDTGE